MAASIPHAALVRVVRDAFGTAADVARAEPLHGDASTRRYVRLHLRGAGIDSAVAMLLGEGRFAPGSDELGEGEASAELPFVNVGRWLAAHEFPVPVLYADRAREDGVLLLEDVGDVTLWGAVEAEPARTEPLFAAAVDLLAQLQVAGARHADPRCVAFGRRFDGALAGAELEHFVDHGIETRHGMSLARGERADLLAALAPLERPFVEGPFALSHRDYMAWNLHVQDGRLRMIDFQDALMAPDAFDLAQLLTDRTTIRRVDDARAGALIDRFRDAMASAGLPLATGFEARYHDCVLQHALKVIGRFYLLEVVRGRPGYLAYLPSVYAVGRRAFDARPELAAARRHVARWVPELGPCGTEPG
jgi:aminoglycoside/choline kinase family phosphotransferase